MRHQQENPKRKQVVILGGGFGGLYAAQALKAPDLGITLVDRRNFHLFQPLLYQVATGGLSPGDIASPLRAVLKRNGIRVISAEAVDIDPKGQKVLLSDGELPYDFLVVATGSSHHYFGHPEWEPLAPGLKTVEDALEMRRRIFLAFETAERESDPQKRRAWLNFVVVGGGPTGVELAGALAELAYGTLKGEFQNIDTREVKIFLLEGTDRLLPPYPPKLSGKAEAKLRKLGVEVRTQSFLTKIEPGSVSVRRGEKSEKIPTHTVLWAAGVAASPLGKKLGQRCGIATDKAGRLPVEADLSLAGFPNLFVIGDLALFAHQGDAPLPGVAPVAMQEGRYVAKAILDRLRMRDTKPFHYVNKGNLAVIGRNAAVADLGFLQINGFFAWLIWTFVHIRYLIGFDNKLLVLMQWAWNYFTRNRGARLITGEQLLPLIETNFQAKDSHSAKR
ncbi:MAG: NAD(P)/FAD-dependent oxidoreductase [Deltaproteobacteria bacterium]|nr:NAD(P)/FAD-dependent oxidoreductase [Deltaproteobacteria bacterium]